VTTTSMDASDQKGLGIAITEIKLRIVEGGTDGLLAWASCVVGGAILLNNIAVRRGRDGGLILTYPAKQTAAGTRFHYFNPITREAADAVERAITAKIRDLSGVGRTGQSTAVENG
jgi:DNA-binding cell septation regulator SpoVG